MGRCDLEIPDSSPSSRSSSSIIGNAEEELGGANLKQLITCRWWGGRLLALAHNGPTCCDSIHRCGSLHMDDGGGLLGMPSRRVNRVSLQSYSI